MPVEMRVGDRGEHRFDEPVAHRREPLGLFRQLLGRYLGGASHADDRGQVLGTRTKALLLPATHHHRREPPPVRM